ncbi:MAG: hypothetical protein AAF763_17605, partial [Pseudomonadota bacterium]
LRRQNGEGEGLARGAGREREAHKKHAHVIRSRAAVEAAVRGKRRLGSTLLGLHPSAGRPALA